jgi:hypothetical protein
MVALLRPVFEEALALVGGQPEEVVIGRLADRRRARDDRVRILQVGGRVGRAAGFAGVAVLVPGAALRAFALDEAVGQEHRLHRVVELFHRADVDEAPRLQRAVDAFRQSAGLVGMRRVVVVEADEEAVEVALVFPPHAIDELLGRDAFLLGAEHDRRAVRVVGAHVVHLVSGHLLEADPDVGLDVFDEVAEVDAAVGVRQCGRDEQAAGHVLGPDFGRRGL